MYFFVVSFLLVCHFSFLCTLGALQRQDETLSQAESYGCYILEDSPPSKLELSFMLFICSDLNSDLISFFSLTILRKKNKKLKLSFFLKCGEVLFRRKN